MREIARDQATSETYVSDLVDVTTMPLLDLVRSEETALSNAIRRRLDEIRRPQEPVAGWSSYV
jgi:FXSXX-COOH protein